jgi:RNA polymerase sigma-70 factor (ECF subfamily)
MATPIPEVEPSVIAAACAGDRRAHAELYERFAPLVYTLARRMLVSPALAEDVLQETFVEVLSKIETFRGESGFGFWVRRIAVNKCLMQLRSSWVSRRSADEPPEQAASDHGAERLESQAALEVAFADLSPVARAVVWLHDVEGYTHREIAESMGKTTSFSKSQLARAHERLRELLGRHAADNGVELCAPVL